MEIIIIPGTFPNLNQIIAASKKHWSIYAKLKRTYTDLVTVLSKNHAPVQNYPVSVRLDWYCKDRRVDPDGIAASKKMILDGLVAAGILEGDGWAQICELSDKFFVDAEHPRVVISIRERDKEG